MRAMDVPARIVTGYQGAEPPDDDGFRTVRQRHAHAWAEYWDQQAGWIRADPTSAVAPERVRAGRPLQSPPGLVAGAINRINPALLTQIRRAWELADSRWTQWVMGYSSTRQFNLLQRLGVAEPDWTDLARALVGLLSLAASAGAAWAWLDRRRQDPWQRLHQRLCRRLQGIGVAARPHQPPRTLAAQVRQRHGAAGEALAQALESLDRQRYAAGGQRLPARGWWPAAAREVARLRSAGAATAGPATGPVASG